MWAKKMMIDWMEKFGWNGTTLIAGLTSKDLGLAVYIYQWQATIEAKLETLIKRVKLFVVDWVGGGH
jgi:hypothetical protein